jgi:mRNA-degrading endonuclease RelE of RelBE toxin-antitoxin system
LTYRIEYSPDAADHLRALSARHQANIIDNVEEQLAYQPAVETRNRKPMRPNPVAPWELRIGQFRVYYDIEEKPKRVVFIRAVGIKKRNCVQIGNEVLEL